jgi:hypothetical protein
MVSKVSRKPLLVRTVSFGIMAAIATSAPPYLESGLRKPYSS